MTQTTHSVAEKSTGNTLTAAELNDLADAVNANAGDAETRLATLEAATAGAAVEVAASRDLAASDAGRYLRVTAAATLTLDASALAAGTVTTIRAATDGAVALAEGDGVTINPPYGGSLTLAGEGATAALKIISATEADLVGQTAAP
jgi:hypothetical protein